MDKALELALKLIVDGEGFSAIVYKCPAGYPTVGYGRNLDKYPLEPGESIPVGKEEAKAWTLKRAEAIYNELSLKIDSFKDLTPTRQAVLIDMAYNLGVGGLLGFKRALRALAERDYEKAYLEILDSRYARQTKTRAKRNAQAIRSGDV